MNARGYLLALLLLGSSPGGWSEMRAAEQSQPGFLQEVMGLLQTHLQGVGAKDLDQKAVDGLIKELQGAVLLKDAAAGEEAAGEVSVIPRTDFFDDSFAYARIQKMGTALGNTLASAVAGIAPREKIKGLVLDLRFASGSDYGTLQEFADLFLPTEQDLWRLGERTIRGGGKPGVPEFPLIVLINRETKGPPEVIASLVKEQKLGLVIGERTAGQARSYRDFKLSNGQTLRIAADASTQETGVAPDIAVRTNPADERRWLDDPYGAAARTNRGGPTNNATVQRRRINEADLVRMRRNGNVPPLEEGLDPSLMGLVTEPLPPFIRDPALARALDLLKGLAVARARP